MRFCAAALVSIAGIVGCAVHFPDYPLGKGGGGASTSSSSSSGSTASQSSSTGTSSSLSSSASGCGAETMTDSANCGTCGHDCLGGKCKTGQCQPAVIAEAESHPTSIALDKGDIYWAANSSSGTTEIHRLAKAAAPSTPPSVVLPSFPGEITALVTDGTATTAAQRLYYVTRDGGAWVVPTAAGGPTQIGPTSGTVAMTIGGGSVLWGAGAGSMVAVYRYDISQAKLSTLVTPQATSAVTGISTDGLTVYWSDTALMNLYQTPLSHPCDENTAGDCVLFASGRSSVGALVVDANSLYFSEGSPVYAISQGPRDFSTARQLAWTTSSTSPKPIFAIAVDTAGMYWADPGDASIRETAFSELAPCGSTGAPACTTLDGPSPGHNPNSVAVDDAAIYWAFDSTGNIPDGTGTITRLAK